MYKLLLILCFFATSSLLLYSCEDERNRASDEDDDDDNDNDDNNDDNDDNDNNDNDDNNNDDNDNSDDDDEAPDDDDDNDESDDDDDDDDDTSSDSDGDSDSDSDGDPTVAKYAVIVGVNNGLQYCDEDANDWYDYLVNTAGYPAANVTKLIDGQGTVTAIKNAVQNVLAQADSNDIVTFTTSGHGSNGVILWANYATITHTTFANMFSGAAAGRIFIFIDHCNSGGAITPLMSLSNKSNIYVTTTCSATGYGYDDPQHSNGMWTYYYEEWGLEGQFSKQPTASETCFDSASGVYPQGGADAPQEGDGDTGSQLFIWDSKAMSSADHWVQPAASKLGTLAENLSGATQVVVDTYGEFDAIASTSTLRSADAVDKILTALGKSQFIEHFGPRCFFDKAISFKNEAGVDLGKIGICSSPEPREDLPSAFIPAGTSDRYGIHVEDIEALLQAL